MRGFVIAATILLATAASINAMPAGYCMGVARGYHPLRMLSSRLEVYVLPSSYAAQVCSGHIFTEPSSSTTTIQRGSNLSFDQVLTIARTMRSKSLSKSLTNTIKEVLGSVRSAGGTVDGQSVQSILNAIDSGQIQVPAE